MGLLVAFVVLLVLGYRRHSRVSRDRANLRISRDRANFDLQMMSHQSQVRVQIQSDESASLPDSLPSKRSTSLRKAQATSLPPGPPSSSNDQQSVVGQEEEPALSAAPATWLANRFGTEANSGEAVMAPAPSTAARTFGPFSLLRHASSFSAPPKRPAQPESASAPRAKRAFTLDSPPAVLPPGAPSASGSSIAPPPAGLQSLAEGKSTQSSDSALTAPALGLEEDFEPTAAELAAFLEDEEVMLEMQSLPDILGSTPAWANPEMVADVRAPRQRVVADRVQEAVQSAPTPPEAEPSGPGWLNERFNEIDGTTRGQQALHMARQRMQIARTDAEINQVVNTLALALGATRPEDATLKALFAVLVHLNRPEMSEREVCASTGASFGNFKRWRRRVLNA